MLKKQTNLWIKINIDCIFIGWQLGKELLNCKFFFRTVIWSNGTVDLLATTPSSRHMTSTPRWACSVHSQSMMVIHCWSISKLPTFPYQLKLLGWTGWCMQLNMVSEPEVSSSNPGGALIKIITAHSNIPRMRPRGACTWGGVLEYKWIALLSLWA
jgi:hypothetical protein